MIDPLTAFIAIVCLAIALAPVLFAAWTGWKWEREREAESLAFHRRRILSNCDTPEWRR